MNGFLIIDKPLGYTSRDVVNEVSKIFNTKKIGHTGTLDPNASGVMILCVGKALKMASELTDHNKDYLVTAILGVETDTLDMDYNATLTDERLVDASDKDIMMAVNSFKGTYLQEVPMYSAVKVDGRKLYQYAREGKNVELPKRPVTIFNICFDKLIKRDDGKAEFTFSCSVSKGTYIRSLVRDIGKKLGVPAVVKTLVRTKVGCFNIADSYSLEDIKNGNFKLLNIQDVFKDIKRTIVDDELAFKIKNGVIIDNLFAEDVSFIFDKDNNLLSLYKKDKGKCRPYKMFV